MLLKFFKLLILTTFLFSLSLCSVVLVLTVKCARVILLDSFYLQKRFFVCPFFSLKLNSIFPRSFVFTSVQQSDEAPTAAYGSRREWTKNGMKNWNWAVFERDFSFQNDIKIAFKSTRNLSNWNVIFCSTHSIRRVGILCGLPETWEAIWSFAIALVSDRCIW